MWNTISGELYTTTSKSIRNYWWLIMEWSGSMLILWNGFVSFFNYCSVLMKMAHWEIMIGLCQHAFYVHGLIISAAYSVSISWYKRKSLNIFNKITIKTLFKMRSVNIECPNFRASFRLERFVVIATTFF